MRSSPGFVASNNYMYVPSGNIIGIEGNQLHTVSDASILVSLGPIIKTTFHMVEHIC